MTLIALVCITAISRLGNSAGGLDTAGETLDEPDMALIDNNSANTVSGGQTDGNSNSAFGNTAAAIRGVTVEDRGFEDGLTRNWDNYATGDTIGAWTVVSGNVDTHSTAAYGNGNGDRFIDLNGFGPGEIEQGVTVVPGVSYILSVTVSENQCGPAVKGMEVIWNNVVVSDLQIDLPRGENRVYEVTLPASPNENAVLGFRSTTSSVCGAQIDEPTLRLNLD